MRPAHVGKYKIDIAHDKVLDPKIYEWCDKIVGRASFFTEWKIKPLVTRWYFVKEDHAMLFMLLWG